MRATYLGEVVLQRRNHLGLPQEMVCEGLCTPMTLSRFEKGRQTPSRDCVEAILQRLGLPDDRYFAQLTRRETKLIRLRKDVLAAYGRFAQTLGEEQQQALVQTLEKLRNLERCIEKDDHINQQFILGTKVSLEGYPSQKQLEVLMDAIHLTSPRFDLDDLSSCLYSANEVVIISKIAIVYSHCGQRKKAIDIYERLLELIQHRTPNHSYLPLIAYNCARYLAIENRFEEALKFSRLGRQSCIRLGYYYVLPRFLHIEAECHYLMGEISRSKELYRSAFHIYNATLDTGNLELLKMDLKERFNLAL